MTTVEKYQKLASQVETIQRDINRAEGSLSTQLEIIKEEFSCNDIELAQKLLEKLKKEAAKNEKDFQTALENFEDKWKDTLNDQET